MKRYFILFLTCIYVFIISGCTQSEYITKTDFLLDTVVTIKLYSSSNEENLNSTFKLVRELESLYSRHIPTSEISKINNTQPNKGVMVSDDTILLIKKALNYSNLSEGYFDITIGNIIDLWSIGTDKERIPSQNELEAALLTVNYKDVSVKDNEVTLKNEGTIIDLGGIAKGYITDKAAEHLKSKGEKHAILDFGGNIYVLGSKPDGTDWNVAIRNPFGSPGEYLGSVSVSNKSVVTSGIYERYLEENGVKYHHLLNPFTGYPSNNELVSVSIISENSVDGDALSTAVFVMGKNKGLELIEKTKNVEAILVTKNNEILLSSGLISSNSFKLLDKSFTIE